jgi:hypothetical protein
MAPRWLQCVTLYGCSVLNGNLHARMLSDPTAAAHLKRACVRPPITCRSGRPLLRVHLTVHRTVHLTVHLTVCTFYCVTPRKAALDYSFAEAMVVGNRDIEDTEAWLYVAWFTGLRVATYGSTLRCETRGLLTHSCVRVADGIPLGC